MPKRIPIKALKDLAAKYCLRKAVLIANDGERDHIVTYGKNLAECDDAAVFGNQLKKLLTWPESTHGTPSRVKRLLAKIEYLENRLKR